MTPIRPSFLLTTCCALLLPPGIGILAQDWEITGAPTNFWTSVAASADATKLVACDGFQIYTSTNSGQVWTLTSAPIAAWAYLASSAGGDVLVAAANNFPNGGPIYISTNSGATWGPSGAPLQVPWSAIAASADATKLAGVAFYGTIYTSSDSGATWSTNGAPKPDSGGWECIASSADGTKLVALASDPASGLSGSIYTSADSGTNWTQTGAPKELWWSVASSADGVKLVAVAGSGLIPSAIGPIYTSTNSGLTWTPTSAPQAAWVGVSSSADGTTLAAVIYNGGIYTSADSGLTWVQTTAPSNNWFFVTSSADGGRLVAASGGYSVSGQIYSRLNVLPPSLTILPLGDSALISWTIPSTSFDLQQSADLGSSGWTNVEIMPELNLTNLQNLVTVPSNGTNYWYRLRSH